MTKESTNQAPVSTPNRAWRWLRENIRAAGVGLALGGVAISGVAAVSAEGGGSACNPEIENCTPGTTVPGQESTSSTGFNDKGTSTTERVTTTTEAPTTTSTSEVPTTTAPGTTTPEASPTTTSTIVAPGPEAPIQPAEPAVPQAAPTS